MSKVIIGGGPAGFFAAIACAQANPQASVILLEKTRQPLAKVRVSGGGRCNVTHACFDPAVLVQNYPRGGKELRGPFSRFQPRDTIAWFAEHGVTLKTEPDGRMFPATDSSETIIQCLVSAAKAAGVQVRIECGVTHIERKPDGFILMLTNGDPLSCDRLLIATGSSSKTYGWLTAMGHKIQPLVPSLFTFNIPNSPLIDLAGISVHKVQARIIDTPLVQSGPLLITHWGFSGPAILKLSAWGARILHDMDYKATLQINWLPELTLEELKHSLQEYKRSCPARLVTTESPCELPRNLWKSIVGFAKISSEVRWSGLSNDQLDRLIQALCNNRYQIDGKSTYKEEFVTCGGVRLEEVNFKTMESRIIPRLHFAGEVLDIDGVTGGFNFQNGWTTAWIAGQAMAF